MTANPIPDDPTRAISTASRRRLKYWPTINVAVSRVSPTPIPYHISIQLYMIRYKHVHMKGGYFHNTNTK